MLYMSGSNDTLKELKEGEGYAGSLDAYAQQYAKANPELCSVHTNYKAKLPPYTPMYLVTVEAFDPVGKSEVSKIISGYSLSERRELRKMQEDGHSDIATPLAMSDFLEELQSYAHNFREALKIPLISTPWQDLNNSLTNKSLIKIFGESSAKASDLISKSVPYKAFDKLYDAMMKRDALSREWHKIRDSHTKAALMQKKELEKQIAELTKQIRTLLPKKVKDKMSKYVRKVFSDEEIRKMRSKIPSARVAGRKKLLTTNLDMLNRTGLGRLRAVVTESKWIGQGVSQFSRLLNWGAVAYDTVEAYSSNGNYARAFLTGAASVVVATELTAAAGGTAALGGYVIGALAGDLALGATILVCSPVIGWAVLVVAGVATAGYVAYKAKEAVGGVIDLGEYADRMLSQEVSKALNNTHQIFKKGWEENASWMPKFYGNKDLAK